MKKLMFALVAGVAATVATAASITQSDFETGYTAGTSKPTTVEASKFGYAASNTSEDGSVVKAYDAEVTAYAGDRNAAFVGANNNYLELNTDGGTLYRSINDIQNEDVVGAARNVTSSLYIDTLVQFTVCDSVPEIDNSAKLAIWLQTSDDEATTNLMVRAKTYAVGGDEGAEEFTGVVTNFVIGAANAYQAGTWYRLTVEAVPNVFSSTYGAAGFKIRINGNYVKADRAAFTGSTALVADMVADYNGLTNAQGAEATIFLPINGDVDSALAFANNPLTLCAVGFSGTGAVDDILFTEDNPFFTAPTTLDFTLTLAENVSSVTYSINGAAGVTIEETTEVKDVPVGATITLSNFAFETAEWQTFSASVAAGANATAAGTTVTLKAGGAFQPTDENLTTAGATVSAVANVPAGDASVASFLETLGLNSELAAKFTTVSAYESLMSWVAANNYTKARINAYPLTYERMLTGYPIEMMVAINPQTGVITSYDASATGTPSQETGLVSYTVDAGMPFTLSNFVFEAAQAYHAYELNDDMTDATWNVMNDPSAVPMAGCSAVVADGAVVYTTFTNAQTAVAGIGYKLVATASAVAQIGETEYYTLNDAVAAARDGDTIAIVADCTVTQAMVFAYGGVTVSNDYVVTITNIPYAKNGPAGYAFRFANGTEKPVTFCGSGSFRQSGEVGGSPFLVGNNEAKGSPWNYSTLCSGSVVLNSGSLEGIGSGNNLVKVEDGTFVMNGGSITGGTRGVKADTEHNDATAVVTINGGVISSATALATSTAGSGSSTLTINGGQITGPLSKGAGTTLTIPSTSTAQFDNDRSAYCVADYKTALDNGWYVVTPKVYYTAIELSDSTLELVATNETAELVATLTPASAADDTYTWASSAPAVATVDQNGVVTAVAAGTATITVTATHDPTVTASCTVTVTAPEPEVTPLNPGESDGTTYNDQAAAEAAAAKVEPAASTEVATALGEATATYLDNFEAKAVPNGDGTYSVKVELKADAEAALEAEATTNVAVAVAAQLSEIAADATGEQTSVSVTGATPGFYYSISYGTSVGAINTEGDRVMAGSSGSVTLQTPAKAESATSGFYKVNINVAPKPVTP